MILNLRIRSRFPLIAIFLFLLILSCEKLYPPLPADYEILGGPMYGLSNDQLAAHSRGNIAFRNIFTPETGLGPYYVTTSCWSCHAGYGKGHPFNNLTRFGKLEGTEPFNHLLNQGGPQLQNRAITGHIPEAIPSEATGVVELTAPHIVGLGLLESVSDADILAMADPMDLNGDGISGVPNWVYPPSYFVPYPFQISDTAGRYIGRFGKKSVRSSLLEQIVGAYKEDIGITTPFDMKDPINYAVVGQQFDDVPDPEIPNSTVQDVLFFLRTIQAPVPRDPLNPDVMIGKQLFNNIRCNACHTPSLVTTFTDVFALSNVRFYPYTDLLLHDLGPELDDGYTEGSALTSEWRTRALWGLGLSPDSQGGGYYLMHDGRARSIDEAILMHGGEAEAIKNNYLRLGTNQKQQIIKFLESL